MSWYLFLSVLVIGLHVVVAPSPFVDMVSSKGEEFQTSPRFTTHKSTTQTSRWFSHYPRGSLSLSFRWTRSDKCVFCEYLLQEVERRLRNDPSLGYTGPPPDYPYKYAGTIYGAGEALSTPMQSNAYPKPPKPHSMIKSMNKHVPPPPFVAPPPDRLLPSEIAGGKGRAQDALNVMTEASLKTAALNAARTFALPGANGNNFQGGLAELAGKNRPTIMAPVDTNEVLTPISKVCSIFFFF